MKQFLVRVIDIFVIGLVKLRYKLFLHGVSVSETADILERWKKNYPTTFDLSKTVAPLDVVPVAGTASRLTHDLKEALEKDVPLTSPLDNEVSVFPPKEKTYFVQEK